MAAGAEVLTLAGFCLFLFFFGLSSFGLVGADEPRYAQVAREMLARHDWITPILNGHPWLEKPPLYYWGAMLSYSLLGVSDWAARIPSVLLASLMVAGIWLFMRRFRRGSQLDAALIAASCAATIGFGRAASTDMPLAATFTLGMLGWLAWRQEGRKLWLAAFYLFIALGTLAKGPVAPVLAGAIIVLFALARRDLGVVRRTLWWPGIVVYLAVALPWYVAVQLRVPEFFRVFIVEHNFSRYTSDLFRHRQPIWYYAPVLLLSLLPWTAPALAAVVSAVRQWIGRRTSAPEGGGELPVFLLIWAAVPVVFFTFSGSKLPGYILPAVLPLAILLANWLCVRLAGEEKPSLALLALHSAFGAMVLGAILLFPYRLVHARPTATAWMIAAAATALIFAGMTVTLRVQGLRWFRFVTLVPVVVGVAFIVRIAAPTLDATQSARPVARDIARIETHKSEIAGFKIRRQTEYGLTFYRNQPVQRYERGEIPRVDHLVVAGQGTQSELQELLPGRRVSRIGGFAAQKLEYFWVSTPREHSMR
jgi:4-amino-4-deoxy-L-arabinose transferase-like glycosyltransferase